MILLQVLKRLLEHKIRSFTGSGQITINGQAVALGGSITLTTETRPTFSSITPSTIENTQTTCTIAGTNFVSTPLVTAINSSTGATVVADEVSFSSATSITAKFTLPVDGTYKLYIENPDGNAVQTGAVLTVSDAPAWVTAAGSVRFIWWWRKYFNNYITATNSTSFSLQSGSLPGGSIVEYWFRFCYNNRNCIWWNYFRYIV